MKKTTHCLDENISVYILMFSSRQCEDFLWKS